MPRSNKRNAHRINSGISARENLREFRHHKEHVLTYLADLEESIAEERPENQPRTTGENRLLILIVANEYKDAITNSPEAYLTDVSLDSVFKMVSEKYHVTTVHLRKIFEKFSETGEVLGNDYDKESKTRCNRGRYERKLKISHEHVCKIVQFIDEIHGEGGQVTRKRILNFLCSLEIPISVSKSSITRLMKKLGLTYKKGKAKA